MEFIHSVMAQDEAVAVGTTITYDLPVNPLSHVLLTLKFAKNGALTYVSPRFANVLAMMSKIEILYKGSAVFSMSGLDAFACGLLVSDFESWGINQGGVDDDEQSLTWCLPLTRILYSDREAFPRSTRGELVLQITYAAAFTEIDTVRAQIETIELPDAAPERYLRMTTLTMTATAGGENDVELPIGHPISDLVLFGTTVPCADAHLATIGYVQILLDNVRHFYSHTNFESLHNMAGRMRAAPGFHGIHTHYVSALSIVTGQVLPEDHVLMNHIHVPFDIFKDGKYALQTAGKSDVIVRIGVDTAASGVLRVIPCEIIPAGGGY